ncbi:MAG: rRNA maturation RNase YbeY [Chloroflexi bacterium]|nr:rRNA maturation RNase YbeY [Chloroflexota bacterium]
MIALQIADEYLSKGFGVRLINAAQKALMTIIPDEEGRLTIVLTDDQHLQKLNKKYLDVDAPTDVLAFPSDQFAEPNEDMYYGDIIISHPRAVAQAKDGGHTVEQELELLVVHAALHLMGFDHSEEKAKANMWAVQHDILEKLGNKLQPD